MNDSLRDTSAEYEIWWLVHVVRAGMYSAMAKELSPYGLSPEQAAVLFSIKAIGREATLAELSRWLFRKPHSASDLVSRMKKSGLVRKSRDLEKKNWKRVTMTKKGQQAYLNSLGKKSIARILSCLSEGERQKMREYLEKLRCAIFEELGIGYEPPFPPVRSDLSSQKKG